MDNNTQAQNATRCGNIAIVGRPNVGKSTLMNRILGTKLCITSRRPQTTQRSILGVKTVGSTQFVYYDTPGMFGKRNLGRRARVEYAPLAGVDVCLFVLEAQGFNDTDRNVLDRLLGNPSAVMIAVINKVDLLPNREAILPLLDGLRSEHEFSEYLPISATRTSDTHALETLEACVARHLPLCEHQFAADYQTDCTQDFMVMELIREKVMRQMGDELPYAVEILLENCEEHDDQLHIHACIQVERSSHKKMLIGKGGTRIKKIGTAARLDIEKLLATKVMLNLRVRMSSSSS